MAKTKPQNRARNSKKNAQNGTSSRTPKKSKTSPESLLVQAATFLQTSQPDLVATMSAAPHTSLNPTTETPSTSETGGHNLYPKDSVPAANVSNQESKVGQTEVKQGSAEKAAEKLYEGTSL